MIFVITTGEYDDYRVHGVYQGPAKEEAPLHKQRDNPRSSKDVEVLLKKHGLKPASHYEVHFPEVW